MMRPALSHLPVIATDHGEEPDLCQLLLETFDAVEETPSEDEDGYWAALARYQADTGF